MAYSFDRGTYIYKLGRIARANNGAKMNDQIRLFETEQPRYPAKLYTHHKTARGIPPTDQVKAAIEVLRPAETVGFDSRWSQKRNRKLKYASRLRRAKNVFARDFV